MRLIDLGRKLLEAAERGQTETVQMLLLNGAPFTTDWVCNNNHSARGSVALLYKRCDLNRKLEIFDPPWLENLGSDRPETQILESRPGGDPTAKNG